MARIKPTTTFTTRTKPTTSFSNNRAGTDYLLQECLGKLLLESGEGALLLESAITNNFDTNRYAPYLQTSDGQFVTDESGVILEGVGVSELNIIQSNWI